MRWTFVLLCLAACEASIDAGGGSDAGTAGGKADAAGPCTSAVQCPGAQVCAPSSGKCVTTLACVHHADCGKQAYCTTAGTCAKSELMGPCDTTDNCAGQEKCIGGHCACGGITVTAAVVAPNMLIALDRSQSMVTNNVPGTNDSRWDVAKRAIKSLVTTYDKQMRFGLAVWPGKQVHCEGSSQSTDCKGMDVGVAPMAMTSGNIGAFLDDVTTCNLSTPIGGTLEGLLSYAGLEDTARDNYVILVTDGDERCNGDGPGAATMLRMLSPSVKTFAVGFGGDVDKTVLNAIATNGGTPRAGDPKYYQADDEATLKAAFATITGSALSCTYSLASRPDDPSKIFVYFGATAVAQSRTNGWDYDAGQNRITFYGAACQQLQGGTAGALTVAFGCPVVP
jgi:hypothetical protein